ncbi:DUF445 domain-containing protein [Nocardioides sp. CPCC 206347]|uniref:DUF445 domain-containing protein n=1 Tax=Nocardioides sp. CPCC 206347 TaxID=3406463 RepID=UPI003B42BDF1
MTVLVQTWPEIQADFSANWIIYASMPIVAAFIGYITKLLALQMMYAPLEFRGIGPLGWQGLVPRRAGKVAATTIELLTENLLKPEELLDKVDAEEAVEELRGPLTEAIDIVVRDLAEQLRPGLWDSLPEAGRRAITARVHQQAPKIVDNLLAEMRADLSQFLDLQFLAVTILVKNKDQLNDLIKSVASDAMTFVRRSGIVFGFAIGFVQLACWAYFHNPWIMPAFGFLVGFVSDYVALNMLFRPMEPKKALGIFPVQGVLHAKRDKITRGYAHILATDIFAPEVIFEAILHGPTSDRLFSAIEREISRSIDAQSGIAQPLVRLAVGTQRYRAAKDAVVERVIALIPDTMAQATGYAERTFDVENLIVDKMSQLTPEQYESIMRPVFKDDEWLMISVGAVLGGVVGEIQVLVIEHFAR